MPIAINTAATHVLTFRTVKKLHGRRGTLHGVKTPSRRHAASATIYVQGNGRKGPDMSSSHRIVTASSLALTISAAVAAAGPVADSAVWFRISLEPARLTSAPAPLDPEKATATVMETAAVETAQEVRVPAAVQNLRRVDR